MHDRGCGRGHAWQGRCMAGGVHGRRMCVWWGHVWQGACMAGGTCLGGMCGGGACMVQGMHGRGHVWQGACIVGKTAIATGSTHPAGMHSVFMQFSAKTMPNNKLAPLSLVGTPFWICH